MISNSQLSLSLRVLLILDLDRISSFSSLKAEKDGSHLGLTATPESIRILFDAQQTDDDWLTLSSRRNPAILARGYGRM